MGRHKKELRNNTEDSIVDESVGEESTELETLPVVDYSLASDKKTTVSGIQVGKKPKFGKKFF